MALEHLSYSSANSMGTCGWQYYLRKELGFAERPNSAAVGGTVVHVATEAIDRFLHGAENPGEFSRAELLELGLNNASKALDQELAEADASGFTRSEWKSYGRPTKDKPNGEDIDWFARVAIPKCIESYIDWRLDNPNLRTHTLPNGIAAIEVEYTINVGLRVPIRGYIDRVFEDEDGSPIIIDLKTGQKPKTDEQLGLYHFALEQTTGQRYTYGAYFYALKRGGEMTNPIDLSHWTQEKIAYKYDVAEKMITAKLFLPNAGDNCFHCGVSQHCAYRQSSI